MKHIYSIQFDGPKNEARAQLDKLKAIALQTPKQDN